MPPQTLKIIQCMISILTDGEVTQLQKSLFSLLGMK